jgi:hypothetical protein
MYFLSEEEIEFISDDIRKRGIHLEDLHQNILDHVCCIIENQLDEKHNFKKFYTSTIEKFYKVKLSEIESETISLLTFKNYYTMKKIMIYSGAVSVGAFFLGSFFKLMHWPGAGALLATAILTTCFLFLPLMFILKSREETNLRDKIIIGIGALAGILFCFGVLFKIQQWPGANIMWFSAIAISFLIFIPFYFFSGIRRPETRINTIVSTVLIVIATGIQFSLISIHPAKKQIELKMYSYLQGEALLKKMQEKNVRSDTKDSSTLLLSEIQNTSKEIKKLILQNSLGLTFIPTDFESKNIFLEEGNLGNAFIMNGPGYNLFMKLKNQIELFNASNANNKIPVVNSILDAEKSKLYSYSNLFVLNSITQIQMYSLMAN